MDDPLLADDQFSKDPNWFAKVYPFKADEFGQLSLPENVVRAKLVSLNSYGAQAPACIMSARARNNPSDSNMSGTFFLFTVDENEYLTLYKIKSYM